MPPVPAGRMVNADSGPADPQPWIALRFLQVEQRDRVESGAGICVESRR
jgi:hypothetical protein